MLYAHDRQEGRLGMKKVSIIGVGALGSHLLLFARNWEVELGVVDFDRIESKNIQSQFHTKMGQGKNKAKALQQAMHGLFGVKIAAGTAKLADNNAGQVLGAPDLVVDCTDNIAARSIIQTYVEAPVVECLHGCLSADGTLARAVWTEHFTPDKEGGEGEATCEDGANLPFHAMAGALLASVAQRFLETGEKKSWQLTPSSLIRIM
jgi:hypothetical protein